MRYAEHSTLNGYDLQVKFLVGLKVGSRAQQGSRTWNPQALSVPFNIPSSLMYQYQFTSFLDLRNDIDDTRRYLGRVIPLPCCGLL